jgi:hypothetical protein
VTLVSPPLCIRITTDVMGSHYETCRTYTLISELRGARIGLQRENKLTLHYSV